VEYRTHVLLHSALLPSAERAMKKRPCGEDVSRDGLREKARWVLGEMERRLAAMGFTWEDPIATQVYTVHDIHPFFADEIVRRGAAASGLTWHYNRPPVVDLEYEMDCRGISIERTAAA
jgi:hypothetical protein